ncbi:MAG: DNA gyrase subunit A [Bacilli bacterium]|nr:DNA gyrase subunit A [Bacilli bacterium]
MMDHSRDRLQENDIVREIETSFLEYSMSVIVARALPDLRDGLKPVHRRILWSMYESGYTPDKPHKKSARIVGDVMGKYHPHGDSSIYEAMVHMAQDFSYRNILVDGHGNFGNIEGYGAAAMRYTEARLSKLSLELLRDIQKETVDMVPNFDESEKEPAVLPSRFPNILVNGTMGIAVGMATNIPPHNLGEVIDGCVAYIDNPDIDTLGLMNYIKGPDFPTGGIILGNSGIKQAYETGRGSITIRSKATIEEKDGKHQIIVEEVPYGVNTQALKQKVAELVHNKVIDGISDYHTDLKNGVKITITLKKDANAQVVLNNLYKHTDFQKNFGIIFLMLDKGVPKTLGLKDIIAKYIDFQKEIITRRCKFDLDKAEKRVHILEGLKIALDHLDEVIKLIRGSKTDEIAKAGLISQFGLSEAQADAILEMKLRRLTGLEREKIENELKELLERIAELKSILASEEKILGIIKDELLEIKAKYSDDRRTHIDMTAIDFIEDESLIPVEDIIVNITKNGYIKRVPIDTYKVQNKGGVGVKGMTTNEEDIVESIISLQTHDDVLFFTNKGKVYRIKGYEIPEFSRQSKGLPVVNLLPIEKEERVMSILPIRNHDDLGTMKITFVTKDGLVKRTDIAEFESIRKTGKIAIGLKENDEILTVMLTSGNDDILICADNGRMIRFNESEIRVLGRSASGVKGIEIPDDAKCVSAVVVKPEDEILIVTENGYGKRTNAEEYRLTHRGSKGVKAMNITEKNGPIISVSKVEDDSDLIIITNNGMIIRIPLEQVSKMSRVTQGIRVITLKDGQKVSSTSISKKEDESKSSEETQVEVVEEPIEEQEESQE